MAKSLQIALTEDPQALIRRAKTVAHQAGITFRGDQTAGNIFGKGFHGSYEIANNLIILTIHEKPVLLPWKLLLSRVRSFLGEAQPE